MATAAVIHWKWIISDWCCDPVKTMQNKNAPLVGRFSFDVGGIPCVDGKGLGISRVPLLG